MRAFPTAGDGERGAAAGAAFPRNWGRRRVAARLCALALAAVAAVSSPVLAKPQRVVSLNQCADELVLRLADRDAIASITWLSQDPREADMAAAAAGLSVNDGLAEQALAYRPDLILVGAFTDPATVALLRQVGAPVVALDVPETFDAVRRQFRDVAAALEEPARGEALVADLDRRLAAAEAPVDASRPPLRAIVLRPGGFTVGPGSLVDEIMRRAGMINLAARLDVGAYPQLPLEKLVMLDADVAVVDDEGFAAPALAEAALAHPAVAALARRMRFVSLPSRLWTCPGPALADAVRVLAEAGAAARRGRAER
jgi:iron complex transport system substrate-binding protein